MSNTNGDREPAPEENLLAWAEHFIEDLSRTWDYDGCRIKELSANHREALAGAASEALQHRRAAIRRVAAWVEGEQDIITEDAPLFLKELLCDRVPLVRMAAAWACAEIGEDAKVTIPGLIDALKDPNDGIRVRGVVILNASGRPQVVYGQRCKDDNLEHEVWITEAELLLEARFTRSVAVGKTVADACFVRDGNTFDVEVDNETMTSKQMREKWQRYGKIDGYILVICHTKARLRRLIRTAELVTSVALFTRFRWLKSKRVQEPWIDSKGNRVRI